jgi:uncharacterized protein (TIGR03435 family)
MLRTLPTRFGGPLAAVVVLVVSAATVLSQTSKSQGAGPQIPAGDSGLAEFEVSSVKPSDQNRDGIMGLYAYPGGRVACGVCTFEMLMTYAFDVQQFQVSGGPSWIRDTPYDVEGKAPESSQSSRLAETSVKSPLSNEQREMLQTLLKVRFQLRFHREKTMGSVYILSRGSGKLNLQEAKDNTEFPWVGSKDGGAIDGDGIAGKNISMAILCKRLSRYMQRPVVDNTNLKGNFDFKSDYTGDISNYDVVPSILTSVQALGLKLKTGKAPVERIIIDQVERPSEN